jgi:uncharacterized protein (TIGR02996 family)
MSDDRGTRLAALVEDDPDDDEAYRAYGDWLEEQGDPRSQLMGMHVLYDRLTAGLHIDRTKVDHLEARITAFFEQHRDHFWGPLAKSMPKPTDSRQRRENAPKLVWRRGFIYKAELTRVPRITIDKFLDRMLSHASARFLVELDTGWVEDPAAITPVLATRTPRSLRRLKTRVGGDLAPLWPALARVHELEIGGGIGYAAMDLPTVRTLHIDSCNGQDLVDGLARAALPALKVLVIDVYDHVGETNLATIMEALPNLPIVDRIEALELRHPEVVAGTKLARIARAIER